MTATSMAVGRYVLKQGAAAGHQAGPYSGSSLIFDVLSSSGNATRMTGTVASEGSDYVTKGTLSASGPGFSYKGVWTVGK